MHLLDFWPPQSPDLNPLDYSIWWHVSSQACRTRHPNIAALKTAVDEVWNSMDESYVIQACSGFRGRLERVIAAGGGYID